MNDLRTAAQQALEALEQSETTVPYEGFGMARREAERKHQAAITTLKAALVEDAMQKFTDVNQELEAALAEPENWELRRLHAELERCKQVCAATAETWREEAALAEPPDSTKPVVESETASAPVQEPVAWLYKGNLHAYDPSGWCIGCPTPLYTAPPQRKPLTEEEIADAANSVRWSQQYHIDFARAVERAHGIGGDE